MDLDRKLDVDAPPDLSSVTPVSSNKRREENKSHFNVVDGFFIPRNRGNVEIKEPVVKYSSSESVRNVMKTSSSSTVSSIINQSQFYATTPTLTIFTKTNSGSLRTGAATFSSSARANILLNNWK